MKKATMKVMKTAMMKAAMKAAMKTPDWHTIRVGGLQHIVQKPGTETWCLWGGSMMQWDWATRTWFQPLPWATETVAVGRGLFGAGAKAMKKKTTTMKRTTMKKAVKHKTGVIISKKASARAKQLRKK